MKERIKMLKILHVIPNLDTGGAEKMLVDIVINMKKSNINCEIAVLAKAPNFFGDKLLEHEIKIYFGHDSNVYSLKNIFFLRNIINNNSYDCIHCHLFGAQLFTPLAMLGLNKDIPLVTTEHSTHNRRRDIKSFYLLDKWMYKKYRRIIAISEDTKLNLVKYLGFTEHITKVIINGIDLHAYKNGVPANRMEVLGVDNNKEILVLMVAGMREQKDPETLIRASKLLPENYTVLFVGDGERMNEVQQYAKDYGSKKVKFLGKRKDIASIMKMSNIFVLSSKWEGFGLVVVEAAATGLPVIASNVPGLNNVVKKLEGALFEVGNENALADLIIQSASNQNNTNLNLNEFSIENTVMQYIETYKSVIS
ncbi:hypothetical protein A6K76_14100 [Caryophanon latum]|uniref:Glycosyl transferase n=2 Tax=Caryophanon latum TaxID=33977 RepID=A0A1C0YIU1_9BACL|nr:hypothetical protein A6K76_14100 [Caryophanon latum]